MQKKQQGCLPGRNQLCRSSRSICKHLWQYFAELKLKIAVLSILVAMIVILAMVSYVIYFTRKRVVTSLEKLALASSQVQIGQFNHIPLDTKSDDEIGRLALVFNSKMAAELKNFILR